MTILCFSPVLPPGLASQQLEAGLYMLTKLGQHEELKTVI